MPRPTLRLAHSPDPDDAFMWWPLFERDGDPPRLDTGRFEYVPVREDIETLNRRSEDGDLEITAMSCAQYPYVRDRYALTSCGSSMGEGYGPKIVAREAITVDDLRRPEIVMAIPGERTSAFGCASLMLGAGSFRTRSVPFDEVIDRVRDGEFDAGLVIHEGQLTFEDSGLHLVADVGTWWTSRTQLPIPLGVNAVRRDLVDEYGPGTLDEIAATLRSSVEYALAHREESIDFALGFAREMGAATADEFVRLYVNNLTLEAGSRGEEAVRCFLGALHEAGLVADPGVASFIGAATTPS